MLLLLMHHKMREFDRIIYLTTNLINGKIYVGQDSKNNPNYFGSGKSIQIAIEKYGRQNFHKEILQYCSSDDELNEMEIYWIDKLESTKRGIGYNICIGGKQRTLRGEHNGMWKNGNKISGNKNGMFSNSMYSIWLEKFGEEKANEKMEIFKNKCSKKDMTNRIKSVSKYSKDNIFLQDYISLGNASKENKIVLSSISRTCNQKLNPKSRISRTTKNEFYSAGGYIWKWKDLSKINMYNHRKKGELV